MPPYFRNTETHLNYYKHSKPIRRIVSNYKYVPTDDNVFDNSPSTWDFANTKCLVIKGDFYFLKNKKRKNFLPSEQVVNYADWQVSNLAIKYLREIVNFCETCSDGAQVECFEQKKRLHNMWHCPFNHCFLFFFYYIYRSAVNWQMSPKTLRKS